ncbi:hemagglutinin repeat-containing protein [Glaesserella parasuis]|nr:hemagglutinin repeat-containing protein [Glaesserella parasuis]
MVEKGKVKVSGKGLDNSRVDYTEIIARETQANAGIWSKKETKVITGKNTVKRSDTPTDLQIIHTKQPLETETQPQFAIDVGELGGMYSGKIHLIGTEKGVGVRNAGHIGVSAENLNIDSQGRIINTGTINAQQEIQLTGNQGIENKGKIENRQGHIQLSTPATIKQDGSIVARGGHIHQTANQAIHQQGETVAQGHITYRASSVSASTSSLIASGVNVKDTAQGEVRTLEDFSAQGKSINIATIGKTTLQGKNLSSGRLNISSLEANLDHSHTSADAIKVNVSQGKIQANNATMIANTELTLTTPTLLETQHSGFKAEKINTTQRSLNTKGATWEQTGTEALKLEVADKLQNSQGTFKTQGDFTVNAQGMDNQQGRLIAKGKLTVTTGHSKLDSTQGLLAAEKGVVINSGELINDGGLIQSSQNVTINTQGQKLSNQQTFTDSQDKGIVALGSIDIQSGHLENQQGVITTRESLHLTAGTVHNDHGVMGARNLTAHLTNLYQQSGTVQAAQLLNIVASGEISSKNRSQVSGDSIAITLTGQLDNQQSEIIARQDAVIHSGQLNNNDATLVTEQGNFEINTKQQRFTNQQGKLSAGANLTIQSGELDNQQGLIQSHQAMLINTHQANLNNEKGQVKAKETLSLKANAINNREGQIRATEGTLSLSAVSTLDNTLGYITAKQQAALEANALNNQRGVVYNEQDLLHLNVKQTLDNSEGKVISKDALTMASASLTNQQGTLYAENQGNLSVNGLLDNQHLGKIYGLGEMAIQANQIDNRGGEIRTQHKLVLNATADINNQKVSDTGSFIESGNVLSIHTEQLNNSQTKSTNEKMTQGILASAIALSAQMVDNQQGKIHSRTQGNLQIQTHLTNHQGEITGDGNLTIQGKALSLNNQEGRLQAADSLSLFANEVTTNGHIEGRDIAITQQKDFVTNNHINANQRLSINTAGNLTNQHNLYADEQVILNANHITNRIDGRISSANTQITAKGDFTNEGLINGVSVDDRANTVIKVGGRLTNTGKGRIYGDDIALQADSIENSDKDYGGSEILSAVVAARGNLDLAAREIENNTAYYLSDNQVGATLFSVGDMTFGRTLNANNQAEGKADVLRNNSSVIESESRIRFGVDKVYNNNTHFTAAHVKNGEKVTEITKVSENPLNETYIIPMHRDSRGNLPTYYKNDKGDNFSQMTSEYKHIPMELLRWVGWSRAGQLVYNLNNIEPTVLSAGEAIRPDMLLASRNQMRCDSYSDGTKNCTYIPAGNHELDSPIWTYAGVSAPSRPSPIFSFDELASQGYKEEDWFSLDPKTNELDIFKIPEEPGVAPEIPVRLENESEVDFQARMTRYQQALETYTQAQKKWDYYQNRIKPYNDWVDEHKEILDAVDKKIEEHNQNLSTTLGQQYFREFWQINLKNRREDESKVLTTVAGQIIAGRNLEANSQSFINDRSVVIAGQDMLLENKIENIDEEGLHRITDTGHKVFTFDKWRGGLKRYFQRKWENAGNYTRIIETPFDMHIFRMEENVDYTANKQISNNLKARTEHQLSLSKVSVNNDTLSSINELRTVNTQLDTHHALRDTTLNSLTTQTTVKDSRTLERVTLSEHQEVRSIQPNLVIPQNVLYRVNANPTNSVLIETDPDFTNQKRWLSSDYMFNALRYEPNQVQKRLGDGFYEQRLVREQINRLTGRNFVGDYTDFDNQYRGLMDAGVTFAQKFNLRPGIALSSEQVAQLTADIVWLESESITLPNGKVENVLVPKVYALAKKGDITGNGALLSGNKVTHKEGEFINSGKVAGRELVQFDSESIRNSGNISGGGIVGDVRGDMENVGGTIEAERAILLNVAGNFNHSSQTHTTAVNEQGYQRTDTTIGRKGLLYVKGENGTLQIQANNIHLTGADIINDGQGQTYISAKNNLNLTALSVGFDEKMGGGNHYRNEAVQSVEVSRVQGKGDVVLSGQNIYSEAAQLEAKQHLALLAENDVVLGTASTSSDYAEYHYTKSGGALGSSQKTTLDTYQDKTQVGTTLGGGDILVSAGNDLKVKNLQAIADKDLSLQAVNNVSISADTNYFKDTHFEQKSKSGVFSGGGIGITFGKKSETHESEAEGWQQSQARSTLGSLSGNVSVKAGNHAHLSGTDLIASKELGKAIMIEGKSTYIGASQDELNSKERHEYKQSGLTIAFSSAVTDAAMAVQSSLKRSEQVKDERLSQLLKVKAANEAAETVQKASKAIDAIQKAGSVSEGLANSDAKISVSIGASKSVSTSHTKQTTHQGSELSAGSVTVRTTEGDNTIVGSKVDAKEVALEGKNINLLGTTDAQSNRSDNKSSSWSVGVFVGKSGGSTGLGIEGAVSIGKGHSNSDSQVQNHTEINTDRLTIKANETTALKGATANINHLALDTKNLHIESVQDVEKYDSKQTQGGISASVAIYGSGSSVSAQFSRNKANVDYAQVNQQSGFNINESSDINVKENTHLKGGVINAQGDKANHSLKTSTLTTESIENRSDIKVSSVSAGVSSDMTQMATSAMGTALSALGNTNESERSQTQAAISQNVNVQITDSEAQKQKTGKTAEEALQSLNRDVANANQKLEKQDLQALQERQEMAQVIGELSQAGINHLVGDKLKEADKKRQEADAIEKENPEKATALRAQAQAIEAEYGLGSNLQMGIRAATAALQGLATGNVNQAAVGAVSPYLNKLIKEQTGDNKEANLIAHAVLGAVEAHVTGNNAAASALGALTAEAAAPLIMQTLYGTEKPENLSDSQKQNVANLSQIAAGLSGGLIGNSTGSFVAGAEIGKRAVENNYLFKNEAARKYELEQKARNGTITQLEQQELAEINKLDEARDAKLVSSCVDKMSSACREESKQVDGATLSYSGSELSHVYAYPVYTAYSTKYEEDYKKAASFSEQYSILTATREKAYADFEARFDLPKGSVNQVAQWSDVIANTGAVISGVMMEKSALNGKPVIATDTKAVVLADDVGNLGVNTPKYDKSLKAQTDTVLTCNNVACFVAGTLIETARGLIPIEQIGFGDLIWSREEFGNHYAYKPVTATKATDNQQLVEVIVENEQGQQETYLTTTEHPFYVEGIGWLKASLLIFGMKLLDRNGSASLKVISQNVLDRYEMVYNIMVDDHHTYHIGELGVWVHNDKCCDLNIGDKNPQTGNKILDIKYEAKHSDVDYMIEANKPSTKGKLISAQYYENPGHHDIKGGNQNTYNASKSVLPDNHLELWKKSIQTKDGDRWAKEVIDGKIIYHRFEYDRNFGTFHWNGSTAGKTQGGKERKIDLHNVPNEIKGR